MSRNPLHIFGYHLTFGNVGNTREAFKRIRLESTFKLIFVSGIWVARLDRSLFQKHDHITGSVMFSKADILKGHRGIVARRQIEVDLLQFGVHRFAVTKIAVVVVVQL